MSNKEKISAKELAELGMMSANNLTSCTCISGKSLSGWESIPLSIKLGEMSSIGTIYSSQDDIDFDLLTYDEYHPDGTNYWSKDAPIAINYYPYNRCSVYTCNKCGRIYLRYNEQGAYHSEERIRELNPCLITDLK
jgi:hypothetical protein